jgi:beta-glucosidase
MNPRQPPDQRAGELLRRMSLDQEIQMVHQFLADAVGSFGAAGYIPPIPSLCVPALVLNDAGAGLGDGQLGVTAYPSGTSQAASWDPVLEQRLGASLGSEAHDKGVNVLLGPDVNITRNPLGGRTSEQLGEDPYLSGQTAAAFIKGVQSQHVIATVKHFDANNQETNRGTIDEVVAPRVLAEIYQPAFQAAIDAGAGAVMCAYNQVNGVYACQNPTLLRQDLDGRMGFKGFVVSDWGATHSTVASALAGLDMEMGVLEEPDALSKYPFASGGIGVAEDYYGGPLKQAVEQGKVPKAVLDQMVERILRSMFAVGLFDHPATPEPLGYLEDVDTAANRAVALHAAEEGSVLLKDANQVLPITGHAKRIAIIGYDAGPGALAGLGESEAGGSVRVTQPLTSTPLAAITERALEAGDTVTYADGSNLQLAADIAKSADVAIVWAGYMEAEGNDLTNLGYDDGICLSFLSCSSSPSNADQLIGAVSKANPHTVVVLNTGDPALMPWLNQVQAILEMWYPGEEDGAAAAALLFGDVDPSGRLPLTFPASLSQLPTRSAQQWPGIGGKAVYSEGLLVGYRWYEAEHITPLFPFGYGLDYTTFGFSGLKLSSRGTGVEVTYTVTNTGHRAGAAVGEVYVSAPPAAAEPPQQLKGFERTQLAPGQSEVVHITLPASAFSYFDAATSTWRVAPGLYTVKVGTSSASEPLAATIAR